MLLERPAVDQHEEGLKLLLANYQKVTADPRKMGYLRFLVKHYAKDPHPWTACYHDNFKRFGPKTAGLCGVLKDTIRQTTMWRGKNDPNHRDHGAPGAAIAESDKGAANPPWGPWMHSKLSTNLNLGKGDKVRRVDSMIAQFGPTGTIVGTGVYHEPNLTEIGNQETSSLEGTTTYDVDWEDGSKTTGMHGHQLRIADTELALVTDEVWAMLEDVVNQCDPCKVYLGIEDAPMPSETFLADTTQRSVEA